MSKSVSERLNGEGEGKRFERCACDHSARSDQTGMMLAHSTEMKRTGRWQAD